MAVVQDSDRDAWDAYALHLPLDGAFDGGESGQWLIP
jgi:hypothetical protein